MEKILIVDDSSVMRKMLQTELSKNDFEVIEAENGKVALEQVRSQEPALVISDINMPVMDGWEFCWKLRKDTDINKTPFIFLSANNEVSDRVRGIELGADDYIIKPFSPQELVARVQSLLQRYKADERGKDEKSLTGNLAKMNLPNLLQFLNMNSMSGVLEIKYQDKRGQIFIEDGDLINASVGEVEGKKALFRILSWKEGHFIFQEDQPVGERVFQENSLKLIMDGLKELDELEEILKRIPSLDSEIEMEEGLVDDDEFGQKMKKFFQVVEKHKTIDAILDASPLMDFQIYQIIDLMLQEGLFEIKS